MGGPIRRLRHRLAAARRDERGLTLVELTVAAALMVLVLGAFGAITTTLIAAQTNGVASENASTNLRFVMATLQSDIQNAVPSLSGAVVTDTGLDAPSTLAAANDELQVQEGPVGSQQTITWTYTPSTSTSSPGGTLTRSVSSSPTATPTSSTVELTNVYNVCPTSSTSQCTDPVFSYFGQSGFDLLTQGQAFTSSVADCTTMVKVHLGVLAGKSPLHPEQELQVQLANVTPGQLSCG